MTFTKKGGTWEVKNSLWIIFSFIFLLNGIGMYYAGKKARVKKWHNYGLLYTAGIWITMIIIGRGKKNIITDILVFVFLIIYIACIIHCFKIRKEYLIRLELLEYQKVEQAEVNILRDKIAKEYGINNTKVNTFGQKDNSIYNNPVKNEENLGDEINYNKEANREVVAPPPLKYNAVPPEIPKVETASKSVIQKELLDINSCNEEELAELPGVGIILAKKAVNLRNSKSGFASVEEFIEVVGIKLYFVERLKTMICCSKIEKVESVKHTGRMVDF